jgi:toxin-antitoxin system PIN domain toxin
VIAVDTNILVYAHREESPFFDMAATKLAEVAETKAPWAIPWPCLHEFLAVVTRPRLYDPPTPLPLAIDQVQAWFESPSLTLLTETDRHWSVLRELLALGRVAGVRVHDARIAALCLEHGVTELWSADRDFGRFPELTVVNPLVR